MSGFKRAGGPASFRAWQGLWDFIRWINKGEIEKQIIYKDKTIKLPWKLANIETSTEQVTRQNPFSGQSIELPEFAAVIYDVIIDFNLRAERYDAKHGMGTASLWTEVRKGLDWFRRHFAKEYMVLLDWWHA